MALKDGSLKSGVSAFPMTTFAHLVFVAIITLVLVWLLHFREGLAFNSNTKNKIFNLHPLLMALGFILISGQGIMVHKTIPTIKEKRKLFHLVLHLIAFLCGVIGIYAVFKFHSEIRIPHMYSLHSWLGLSTISLFGLQWMSAFISFLYPGAKPSTKEKIMPWHAVLGMIIFFMATLSAEIGLAEKFIFQGIRRINQEALVMNFIGVLILLFAISVGVTVRIQSN